MKSVSFLSENNDKKSGFKDFKPEKKAAHSTPYLRQQLHDNKIDQFFWVDTEAPHKRTSWLAAGGALLGSFVPVLLMAKKRNKGLKIDSFKNFIKALDLHYGVKEILTVGLSGAAGGLLGGLFDRKEKRKLDKIEEATYQAMNIAFPALLVNWGIKLCEKTKKLNNIPVKLATTALAIFAGAGLAVKTANKIDGKFFDKYNDDPDRTFKAKDLVVHVDDVVGALILAKIPLAKKLHIEKALPFIFAWSGFHVGEA